MEMHHYRRRRAKESGARGAPRRATLRRAAPRRRINAHNTDQPLFHNSWLP